MRILYLHQYFKTPEEGGAIRSYYVGKALAEKGHEVVMVTSWSGNYAKTEKIAGMDVYYLPVPYSNNMSAGQRIGAFFRYLNLATKLLNRLVPAKLVYATSTPLTIGLLALYLRRRYRIPYIFEVRDLWPEAPIQLGFIKNKLLMTGLKRLEKKIYQHATKVVALSPGIADGIRAVQPKVQLLLAPNMADCSFFFPAPKPPQLLKQWGLEEKFVISYTGAAGVANQLEYFLAAAQACKQALLPVHFIIAAAGSELEKLKLQAQGHENISFLPYGSKEEVRQYLAVSDAAYISFAPQPVLQNCSPNKLFDALAAGKLCIVNTRGWLKELVETHQCGYYANPEQPQNFAEKLLPYLQNRALLKTAQANARQAAENFYSREQITASLVALVEQTA